MDWSKTKSERVLTGAAFTFFLLITSYKLTNAPLWFDETIEYWYSRIMFGKLPYEMMDANATTNMYQRIVSTFQPPLYNFVMFFWLKIGQSEWWFRLFGVVMGGLGCVAVYKSVKKTTNGINAAMAVFFMSAVAQMVYYWQECAEYCLVLGILCWVIYYFLSAIDEPKPQRIILFTVFAVLAVYSQYGAAFPVTAMAVVLLFNAIKLKDKNNVLFVLSSYVVALLLAGVPLVYFFLLKQINNQHGGIFSFQQLNFSRNILYDLFVSFIEVVRWNFLSYYGSLVSVIASCVVIVLMILSVVLVKKRYVRSLVLVCIISYLIYYLCVKLEVYSYGEFASRYSLFFAPLWIIALFCLTYELLKTLKTYSLSERVLPIIYGILFTLLTCFVVSSWTIKLQHNWSKENMKGAVETWIYNNYYAYDTLVYYAGASGFSYYLKENSSYSHEMEDNVVYMRWYRDKSEAEYSEYLDSLYGGNWPSHLYLIASHTTDDIDTLVSTFENSGYASEELFNSDAFLYRLTKEE